MRYIHSLALLPLLLIVFSFGACRTATTTTTPDNGEQKDSLSREDKKFLEIEPESSEVFRVLLTSDTYMVSQMKNEETIKRADDPGGDRYICDELKKNDKIDEVREGVIMLWLYPDSGGIMKVRPQKPTFLIEIDKLLTEDVQRWSFEFPKKYIEPTKLEIRYRVVLRKKQTDEEIIRDMRDKMRESQ